MRIHWAPKAIVVGVFVGAAILVGGIIVWRYGNTGSFEAQVGALMTLGGLPIGVIVMILMLVSGFRKSRAAARRAHAAARAAHAQPHGPPGRAGVGRPSPARRR